MKNTVKFLCFLVLFAGVAFGVACSEVKKEQVQSVKVNVAELMPQIVDGKMWKVERLDGSSLVSEDEITLLFEKSGQFYGVGGCNRYFGSWKADATTLSFGNMGSTKMMCRPDVVEQEDKFFLLLSQVTSPRIDENGRLVLSTEDSENAVVLSNQEQ